MCKSESVGLAASRVFIVATSQGNKIFTLGLTVEGQRQSNSNSTFRALWSNGRTGRSTKVSIHN